MKVVEGDADVDDVDAFVARLDEIGDRWESTVQAFDARYVAGRRHLESALRHAERARGRGDAIARDAAVEVLLYAAGRRQINQALEMGVSAGVTPAVVVVAGGDETRAAADVEEELDGGETLGEYDEQRVMAFFEITDEERAATDATLTDLVCERVALLDVEK